MLPRWVAGLLGIYGLLALIFSLTSPIFEAPDEIEHFRYMWVLAQTGELPDPAGQPRGQFHQPPLYYLLHAPLLAALDTRGFAEIDGRKNPFYGFEFAIPGGDNKNEYLHSQAEAFPYTLPIARTVHLLRLVGIGLGMLTLLLAARIFALLWPEQPTRQTLALGSIAFLPQFVYLSGHLNNDNLLILLATALLYLLLRDHGQPLTAGATLLLGAVLGAAALTKSSAAFLALPVGVALLLNPRWWRWLLLVGAVAALVGGWYYARNGLVYGDLTLLAAWRQTWPFDAIADGRFVLPLALEHVPYVYFTFWARFGSGAVTLGEAYRLFDLVTLLALLGMMWRAAWARWQRRPVDARALIVLAFGLGWLAAAFYLAGIAYSGNQGRYLLPGLAAWGVLLAYGLSAWLPARGQRLWVAGGVLAWGSLTMLLYVVFFRPAYTLETPPPQVERALGWHVGTVAELVGVTPAVIKAEPGTTPRITLVWRALRPADTLLHSFVHSRDTALVRRDSLPGLGKLLATEWQAGATWAETYLLPIPPDAPRQRAEPLLIGLYDAATQERLPVTTADGQPLDPAAAHIVVPGIPGQPPDAVRYRLGENVALRELTIERQIAGYEFCLTWVALAPLTEDYVLFIHGLDAAGNIRAQVDVRPLDVYPTLFWQPNETVTACITLSPADAAIEQAALGLYRPGDFARLPITAADGTPLGDHLRLPLILP